MGRVLRTMKQLTTKVAISIQHKFFSTLMWSVAKLDKLPSHLSTLEIEKLLLL